jgi:hypothetical protein
MKSTKVIQGNTLLGGSDFGQLCKIALYSKYDWFHGFGCKFEPEIRPHLELPPE